MDSLQRLWQSDPLLLSIGIAFALAALYFLLLRRDSVMVGFLCIIGLVVVAIIAAYPDFSITRGR